MLKPTQKGIWHKWQKETWNCLYPLYLYGEWAFKKSWMNTFLLSLLIPLYRSSFAFKVELSASNSLFVFGICNSEVQEILGLFLSYKPKAKWRIWELLKKFIEIKSPAHHCAGLKYAIENCVDYSAAASSAGASVAGASAAGASAAAALRLRRVRFAFFSSLAMFSS